MVVLDQQVGLGELTNDLSSRVRYLSDGNSMFVEFSFDEPTNVTLQVFNILGQEVFGKQELTVERSKVKVLDRQNVMGTYLIRVDAGDSSTVGKVIY